MWQLNYPLQPCVWNHVWMAVPVYDPTYAPAHLVGRVINAKQVNTQVHLYLHNHRSVFDMLSHIFVPTPDVDECKEQQPCAQTCVNTLGSYQCACRDGSSLTGDGRSCQSIPSTPPSTSQTPVGGHADAGKWAVEPRARQRDVISVSHSSQSIWRQEPSQLRGPLLLLVRAMPLSTRTVSNNALRLVPTPDRCLAVWSRVVRLWPLHLVNDSVCKYRTHQTLDLWCYCLYFYSIHLIRLV